jgi:hypothetical protein
MGKNVTKVLLLAVTLGGCAGFQRSCASFNAENFSADWIVVQNDQTLTTKRCWKLPSTSITNEDKSDGIYWLDPHGGHLVHISGWYNRVQVQNGDWEGAAQTLGIDLAGCRDGVYTG